MYKHSRLAHPDIVVDKVSASAASWSAAQARRRSKSQPGGAPVALVGGHVRPGISATLHSFLNTPNGRPPLPSSGRQPRALSSSRSSNQLGARTKGIMASSYATSSSSSPVNGYMSSVSPEPPSRFNPFVGSSSSSLTINSVDSNTCVYDDTGTLLSAGPEAMWKKLLPTQDYHPSRKLVFSLLLNLRTFISPAEMLQKLLQNCIFEQHSSMSNFNKLGRAKLFENVFEFVEEWTANIPYDFKQGSMRESLEELFSLCTADSTQKRRCEKLLEDLRKVLAKSEHYERALRSLKLNIEEPPIKSNELVGLAVLGASPLVVAQQLAHIELERLSMIGADEVVHMLSTCSMETIGQSKDESAGNIRHYIDWFNHLTAFTATEILRHGRKRHRVKCIEFFIDLAKECINIGNFNSLMAVVAGLSVQAVSRLRRTWQRVEKAKLEILQHQLNPSGNFVSYRATLNAAIWRWEGATQDSERVIIPFFGLMLKDLYLIQRACLEPLANGQLNIAMFGQFSQHISNLIKWKDRPCPFKRNSHVLQYLLLAATHLDKSMINISFEHEPPETAPEREQYKKIM